MRSTLTLAAAPLRTLLQPPPMCIKTVPAVPRTTVQRYFSLHYAQNRAIPDGWHPEDDDNLTYDTCVARHHNGLCVICLSPSHPAVSHSQIASIQFLAEFRPVKGKRKRGGTLVEPYSRLCRLLRHDGRAYDIRCSVRGILVERNDALIDRPYLIAQAPLTDGYLAVVLPHTTERSTAVDNLIAEKDYDVSNGTITSEAPPR